MQSLAPREIPAHEDGNDGQSPPKSVRRALIRRNAFLVIVEPLLIDFGLELERDLDGLSAELPDFPKMSVTVVFLGFTHRSFFLFA